jgi:hypothetical protein
MDQQRPNTVEQINCPVIRQLLKAEGHGEKSIARCLFTGCANGPARVFLCPLYPAQT